VILISASEWPASEDHSMAVNRREERWKEKKRLKLDGRWREEDG
jgi:hypothetical protein